MPIIGAATGALGLGGFAAALGLCCSLPWAVALLGVSGAVAFARLAFLIPYAVILSIALLALAFWLAYRPVICSEADCAPAGQRGLRRLVWIATVIVAASSVFAVRGCADAMAASTATVPVPLDDSATALREDFNRGRGSVRLLIVVDPICPGCLRGLDDVNKALLATTDDPRLQTFVVHLPVLGAEAKDIEPASRLLKNRHVRHYWNASGSFGRQLAKAVDLKRDDALVYAWDVWLIYDAAATWEGALPPRPRRLMHQLRALQGGTEFPRLDAEAFAREVRELLARLPEPPPPA